MLSGVQMPFPPLILQGGGGGGGGGGMAGGAKTSVGSEADV